MSLPANGTLTSGRWKTTFCWTSPASTRDSSLRLVRVWIGNR